MNKHFTPRQISFEGITGTGYQGDIALDDIKLLPGACKPERESSSTLNL